MSNKNCVNCNVPLNAPYRFCGKCGTRQPQQQQPQKAVQNKSSNTPKHKVCPNCNETNSFLVRFCTKCRYDFTTGAVPQQAAGLSEELRRKNSLFDKQENVTKYRKHVRDAADDGVLEDFEIEELKRLRDKLKISEELHQKLLGEYNLILGVPFSLELEVSSFNRLKAGFRGEGFLQIKATEYLNNLTIYGHSATQENQVKKSIFPRLRPGAGSKRWSIKIMPDTPGMYSIEFLVHVETRDGQIGWFSNKTHIQLDVPPKDAQVQNVNINFGDDAIAQLSDIQLATQSASESGYITKKHWINIEFQAELEIQAQQWLREKTSDDDTLTESDTIPPISQSMPPISQTIPPKEPKPEPKPVGPVRLDVLSGKPIKKCVISRTFNKTEKVIELIAKNHATFGHHTELPDMQILVEPIHQMTMEDPNLRKSLRISRRHFALSIERDKAYYVELSSGNGTTKDGQRLTRDQKLEIPSIQSLELAGVLEIDAERINDSVGKPSSIAIHRKNSNPNKVHVMVEKELGLWPNTPTLIGHSSRGTLTAPVRFFVDEESNLCLMNTNAGSCKIEGPGGISQDIQNNHFVVLKGKGLVIYIDNEMLILE